jgi:hypothetical protein
VLERDAGKNPARAYTALRATMAQQGAELADLYKGIKANPARIDAELSKLDDGGSPIKRAAIDSVLASFRKMFGGHVDENGKVLYVAERLTDKAGKPIEKSGVAQLAPVADARRIKTFGNDIASVAFTDDKLVAAPIKAQIQREIWKVMAGEVERAADAAGADAKRLKELNRSFAIWIPLRDILGERIGKERVGARSLPAILESMRSPRATAVRGASNIVQGTFGRAARIRESVLARDEAAGLGLGSEAVGAPAAVTAARALTGQSQPRVTARPLTDAESEDYARSLAQQKAALSP